MENLSLLQDISQCPWCREVNSVQTWCFPTGEKGKQNCVRPEEVVGASALELLTLICLGPDRPWPAKIQCVVGWQG